MFEYSYKNIIIDPTIEEVKSYIGKEVYFADSPGACLERANTNSICYSGKLSNVNISAFPFEISETTFGKVFRSMCIILKKEESTSKYLPFSSANEFLIEFYRNNHSSSYPESILEERGMWLKKEGQYIEITHISNLGINENTNFPAYWKDLYYDYKFLNGTPCRKEICDE